MCVYSSSRGWRFDSARGALRFDVMKVYVHDYTKAGEASRLMGEALSEFRKGDGVYRLVGIQTLSAAINVLREYLAEDNVQLDRDAVGYIHQWDTFTADELCQIRDEFGGIIDQTGNANDELDIINVCNRLLEDPEFESYEQWCRNTSNTWTEIVETAENVE